MHDRLGDGVEPAFAEACYAATQGNPLLLNELLKALESDRVEPTAANVDLVAELGPRAASRAVLVRLGRLSGVAVQVARSIAVLGDGADLGLVAALEGLEPEAVAAATRELVRAEILRPDPPIGFVHPLVQAAVYRDLSPGERELHHERAARLLLASDAPSEQIAAHVLAIPPRGEEWVLDVLRRAANAALAKGAPDAAISSLRRALDEPPPPELRPLLLLELGRAEVLTSLPDATAHLREAYEGLSDPDARGHAAEGLARALFFVNAPEEAAQIARRAALELPPGLEDLGNASRSGRAPLTLLRRGAPRRTARATAQLGERSIPRTGLGAKMLAALAAWEWTESAGPADRVVALCRAALDGRRAPALGRDPDGRRGASARARRPRRSGRGVERAPGGGASHRLGVHDSRASSSGAATTSTCAASWTRPSRSSGTRSRRSTSGASRRSRSGRWRSSPSFSSTAERSRRRATLIDTAVYPPPSSDQAILLDRAQGTLLLAEGRAEDALEHADAYEQRAGWRRHPRYVQWRSLKAQALDRLGRQDEAVALAAEELAIAREWGSPGTVGRSLRILGTLEREDGLAHLEEACGAARTRERAPRAREGARRAGRGAAPRPQTHRGTRTAAPRARAGADLRRQAARRRGPSRALRDRRPATHRGAPGSAVADGKRAARRRPRSWRAVEP